MIRALAVTLMVAVAGCADREFLQQQAEQQALSDAEALRELRAEMTAGPAAEQASDDGAG